MPPQKSSLRGSSALGAALILSALGQFFLVQQDKPWTLFVGALGFMVAVPLLLNGLKAGGGKKEAKTQPLSPAAEAFCLVSIFLLAIFLRLYRLDQFPPGLLPDMAKQGLGAMKILHEGWNPFREPEIYLGGSMASFFYWLALGFKFFGPSYPHILFTSVFLSLLAFPFIYWSFRQLAGPRVALLSLFFLAVMRWHLTYSRDGHPAVDFPLYVFGALSFWLWALKSGKKWALLALFLFLAAGCYSYEAFLPFLPVMILYGIYEYRQTPGEFRENFFTLLSGAALFLALTWPVWELHSRRKAFGAVNLPLAIGGEIQNHGLGYLWRHLWETLLMFNRSGDSWFFNNIPHHRMLDDVTGILLVLGVAFALTRWRERENFYGLTGWAFFLLPAFLSVDAAHASRAFGSTPFTAFLAALLLEKVMVKIHLSGAKAKPWLAPSLLAAILALCLLQNFQVYFGSQAKAWDSWKGYGWEATLVGETIRKDADRGEYYLSPSYFNHLTVLFLGYSQFSHLHELRLPEGLSLPPLPPDRDAFFFLPSGQTGLLHLLESLYPGGGTEKAVDPEGRVLVYTYRVPAAKVDQGRTLAGKFLKSDFGLRGEYWKTLGGKTPPVLIHRDALVNFTFRNDFPLDPAPPFSAQWKGVLEVPSAGSYRFLALATDEAQMLLDDKTVLTRANTESGELLLGKGPHKIILFFQKSSGTDTALSLAWKKQGEPKYEVVPASAFRAR